MIQAYTYFFPLLLKIVAEYKSIALSEAIKKQEQYSEEDLRQMTSSRYPLLSHRIAWAKTYLKKAGLISQAAKKAPVQITQNGYLLASQKDNAYHNLLIPDNNNLTHEEILIDTYRTLKSATYNDLLEQFRLMNPYNFEKIILDFLVQMGYGKAIGTPYTNDEGIDGIINKDPLGLEKIYIQVKRYLANNKIGRPALHAFIGSIHNKNSKGLFITTSDFTADAVEYAKLTNLVIINGEQLADLMFDYDFGVQTKSTIYIKQLDEDFFAED
ncbi:MAG: mrr [Burkholderiales bacterium]|jgi:restriction system protein|nr:mrr [Burkholderiales bacterium]